MRTAPHRPVNDFIFLASLSLVASIFGVLPELTELGTPVASVLALLVGLALATAPSHSFAGPMGPWGATGLVLTAACTAYGRELAPDLACAGVLLLSAAGLRLLARFVTGSPQLRGAAELETAGAGLVVATLARQAAFSLPEVLAQSPVPIACWLGSRLGEPWSYSGPWLFPPGAVLHASRVVVAWPVVTVALALFAFLAARLSRNPGLTLFRGSLLATLYLPLRLVVWAWLLPRAQAAGPIAFHWAGGGLQFLSVLPLIGLLSLALGEADRTELSNAPPGPDRKLSLLPGVLLFLAGAGVSALLAPGSIVTAPLPSQMTVAIDETHSDWEPVVVRYDEHAPKETRQNNYVSMARFVSRVARLEVWRGADEPGRPSRALDPSLAGALAVRPARLDDASLSSLLRTSGKSLLVLKCPSRPYAPAEIGAVRSFVAEGGGLLLLGDHSDAFFMNSYLDPVARLFGIRFLSDEHYDAFGTWSETDSSCHEWGSPFALLGKFLWATNCPLAVEPPAYVLVRNRPNSFAERGDYYSSSFFGNRIVDPEDRFGRHPMMAAARYGKGKVLAFSDSTSFNNAFWSYPDRRLLWYLWLDWFARDRWLEGPWSLGWLSLPLLLAAVFATRGGRLGCVVDPLLLGFGLSWFLAPGTGASAVDRAWLDGIDPARVVVDVSHGSRHSIGEEEPAIRSPSHGVYAPFLEEIACLGTNVRVSRACAAEDVVRGRARLVVFASPRRSFSAEEVLGYRRFVESGGRLLLIEGVTASPVVNTLAEPLGLSFSGLPLALKAATAWPSPSSVHATGADGRALWFLEDRPVLAVTPIGNGFVVGLADDRLFAATDTASPSAPALELLRDLVRGLLGTSTQASLAAIAPKAASLDAVAATAGPGVHADALDDARARRIAVFAKLPSLERSTGPEATRRLALRGGIRRALDSTGPIAACTWPSAATHARLAGSRIVLAASSSVGQRLKGQAPSGLALDVLVPGEESRRFTFPTTTALGASFSHRQLVLVVHPSALLQHPDARRRLERGIEALMSILQASGAVPERVQLLPPESIEQGLAAVLFLAAISMGPDETSRWYEEAASLDRVRSMLAAQDYANLLRASAVRLPSTVVPDPYLALMALAAAETGQTPDSATWMRAVHANLAPLLLPVAAHVARITP
ncbi:MAG: hypothetical protein HYY25_06285 [Candidatus Wallbacteria bacterium]|nr:hypothetical protein [Candidatus Wallbacteria bacterium]